MGKKIKVSVKETKEKEYVEEVITQAQTQWGLGEEVRMFYQINIKKGMNPIKAVEYAYMEWIK